VKKQYFCPEECLWISGRNWRIEGWGWKISGLGFGGRTPVETRANGYKHNIISSTESKFTLYFYTSYFLTA